VSAPRSKRLIAILLGAFLVAFFAIWAIALGLSDPDVPSGDVAVVDDAPGGPITQEEFDASLKQAAAAQGAREVPTEGEQYEALKEQALSDLILGRWVQGEAEERGFTVTETEVEQRLDQIKQQNFRDEQEYRRFLDQSGFTEQDALERVRLTLLSERIQEEVLAGGGDIDQSAVEAAYEESASQFEQPEARDVRVILNEDEAQVDQARQVLEQDDSDKSWEQAAKRFSTDQASKNEGGLRSGVIEGQVDPTIEGQADPTFNEQVFAAPEGELVGPFETAEGFYLIQVVDIQEAQTTPLEEASEQISRQLESAQQTQDVAQFESAFVDKWTQRTFCAEDFVTSRCSNAPPPPPAEGAAPVISSRPAAPGSISVLAPGTGGLPQRAIPPPVEQPAGLPPGAAPIGPPGAPPGAAPPTGAPPTGAPPTGAPPTGAPPTGAPPTGAPPTGAPPGAPPPAPPP
jgi:foldase protein PrsA